MTRPDSELRQMRCKLICSAIQFFEGQFAVAVDQSDVLGIRIPYLRNSFRNGTKIEVQLSPLGRDRRDNSVAVGFTAETF